MLECAQQLLVRMPTYLGGGTGEGVTIGEKAVIGSCALVNRDVPSGATAVGIPCRIIEKTETVIEE